MGYKEATRNLCASDASTNQSRFCLFCLLPSKCMPYWIHSAHGSELLPFNCQSTVLPVGQDEVVMSFCVAGVALCDIPTCLITCGKCQNWRKSRTKCSFFCLVSSLWFSCGVAVSMGEAGKLYLFECFQAGCHTLHTLHFTLLTPHSTLYTRHSFALFTPHSTLYTLHFPFHDPYVTLRTAHSTLSTPRSTLHTLHSTLYSLGWWSRDSCGASCHVLLTWLRAISALLSFKILIFKYIIVFFFPECVARVPVSLWGSGGWGCVRSTLRLWSQPSATVRNRSYELCMAVPMGSSAEVVIFGGFQCAVASFRVAGVALRDIQTCFVTCRKSFCVAGAILLRRFQKMCCIFRGRRNTLDVSIVIFCGRRNTLDVSCCVFIANRIGRAGSSGDKVQISWQAWHFVTCAENWRKLRTKHRFWGSNCFQVLRKTRKKTSILKLQSVKSGGGLARNARFGAPTCLVSRVSGFPGASPCLWGKLQSLSFCHVANCENWRRSRTKCSFFFTHVSRLESLVFLRRRRVYGGSCKTSPFRRFPSRLSCRFAWQAWHFVTFQPVW